MEEEEADAFLTCVFVISELASVLSPFGRPWRGDLDYIFQSVGTAPAGRCGGRNGTEGGVRFIYRSADNDGERFSLVFQL